MGFFPAPKPGPKAKKERTPLKRSWLKQPTLEQVRAQQAKPRKPLPRSTTKIVSANPEKRGRRELSNRKYYASAEWREKKRLTHERDGHQCVELVAAFVDNDGRPREEFGITRCANRGEIINGKQTARGLVCEETSYGHRGIPGRIDSCKTRCKAHDRRLTPLERANWAQPRNRKP
jgi:hypothetical protein